MARALTLLGLGLGLSLLAVACGSGEVDTAEPTTSGVDTTGGAGGSGAQGAGAAGTAGTTSGKGGSSAGGTAGSAGSGGGGGAEAYDPCAKQKDGTYCGEAITGTKGTLYVCEGGVALYAVTCKSGCIDKPDGDVCQSDANEPCFDNEDGDHCGESIGGTPNTLYTCKGHVSSASAKCPGDCVDKPAGKSYCESDATEPCFNDADGTYCGSAIGAKQGTNNLYVCEGHKTSSVKACSNGCVVKSGGADVCQSDANEPCFNDGDGTYCGAAIGGDPATLYVCKAHVTSSKTKCAGGCQNQASGIADTCKGDGKVECSAVQWWNSAINYGPYKSGSGWWDTDLNVSAGNKVQLRHDSKLVAEGVYGWGWMPTFVDQKTGKKFRFLHLRPQAKYTTTIGKIYPAGTIVGLSGGDTYDTGKPQYSTGAHLCVQTLDTYGSCFPKGTEPCK